LNTFLSISHSSKLPQSRKQLIYYTRNFVTDISKKRAKTALKQQITS
jgi:hypothetical protein